MNLGDKNLVKRLPRETSLCILYYCRCYYRSSEHSGCTGDSGKKYRKTDYSTLLKVWKRAM